MPLTPRVLVIGYGNPGRGDDGLGPALAAGIDRLGLPGVTVEIDYQLSVDHAALIAAHDLVVFADAMIGLAAPFALTRIVSVQPQALGSHQVTPEAALALAGLLFGHQPPGWMLALAGAEFGEVHEGLSPLATGNLALALAHLRGRIATGLDGPPRPLAPDVGQERVEPVGFPHHQGRQGGPLS